MDADDESFDYVDAGPPYGEPTPLPDWAPGAEESVPESPPPVPERYAALDLEGDAVIVYDCREPGAWVQSTAAVPIGGDAGDADGRASPRTRERDGGR